jgi:hypothetical protein
MAMSAADLAGKDLNLIPAGMPPPGWTGLFSGPELHTAGLAIFCLLAPIACFAVSCRLISSWQTRGSANGGIGLADCEYWPFGMGSRCAAILTKISMQTALSERLLSPLPKRLLSLRVSLCQIDALHPH